MVESCSAYACHVSSVSLKGGTDPINYTSHNDHFSGSSSMALCWPLTPHLEQLQKFMKISEINEILFSSRAHKVLDYDFPRRQYG